MAAEAPTATTDVLTGSYNRWRSELRVRNRGIVSRRWLITALASLMGTVGLLGAGIAPASANDWQHNNPKSDYTYVPEGQEQSRVVGTPTLTPQQEADLAVKDADGGVVAADARAARRSGERGTVHCLRAERRRAAGKLPRW